MGKISVGIAGAIGVLVGILVAPRKGSETREQVVQRSKVPLQEAARKAASRARETIRPVARVVGERVSMIDRGPLISKDGGGANIKEPEGEAGDESPSVSGDRRDGAASDRRARSGRAGTRS